MFELASRPSEPSMTSRFIPAVAAVLAAACSHQGEAVLMLREDVIVNATFSAPVFYLLTNRGRIVSYSLSTRTLQELMAPRWHPASTGVLAVASTDVVSVQHYQSGPGPFDTTITAVPVGGGTPRVLTQVADQYHLPNQIATDGSSVYWMNLLTSATSPIEMLSVPVTGGAVTTIAGIGGDGMAFDDTFVYWAGLPPRAIARAPKAGGAVTVLDSTYYPTAGLLLDGGDVIWGTDNALLKVPQAGGQTQVIGTVDGTVISFVGENGTWYVVTRRLINVPEDYHYVTRLFQIDSAGVHEMQPLVGDFAANLIAVYNGFLYWTYSGMLVRTDAR